MPSKKTQIKELGEKKLIKRLLKRSQTLPFNSNFFDNNSFNSLNDDAALLDFEDKYVVVTTDLLTQTSHFPEEMDFYQIGKKIVTVNVSDLAAMGAKPIGITLAMALPPDLSVSDFDNMINGVLTACKLYGLSLIGGDTNQSDELTLSGTCIGIVHKNDVLMKNGARIGDIIALTGPLGLAAAGFEILIHNEVDNWDLELKNKVIKKTLEPEAKVKTGLKLAESHYVTSSTDITDGLLSELGEIIDASQKEIGAKIYLDLLPIPEELFTVARKLNKDPLEMALTYGEDFELLLTVLPDYFDDLKDDLGLIKIGYVTSSGQIQMVDKEGKTEILNPQGYEHFKIKRRS